MKTLESSWSGPGLSVLAEGLDADFQGPSAVAEAEVQSGTQIGVSKTEPSETIGKLDSVPNDTPALTGTDGSFSPPILTLGTDHAATLNTTDTDRSMQSDPRSKACKTATSNRPDRCALMKCLSDTDYVTQLCKWSATKLPFLTVSAMQEKCWPGP